LRAGHLLPGLERLFYHLSGHMTNICSLERLRGPRLRCHARPEDGGNDGTEDPLDGERLFVSHWWNERTFVPSRPRIRRRTLEPMAAIACSHDPRSLGPSRLAPLSPPGRQQPSVAVRRRRAVGILVILAALGALLGVGSLAGAEQGTLERDVTGFNAGGAPVTANIHLVQPGDTLWSLVRGAHPEGDIRPTVARLQAEHGPGPLVPGERVRLAV